MDVEDEALNLDPARTKSPADYRPKQYAASNGESSRVSNER
jgi:hypothetical protein